MCILHVLGSYVTCIRTGKTFLKAFDNLFVSQLFQLAMEHR